MGLPLWQPGCRYPHQLHGGIWLSVTVEDWNAIYFAIFARRPALKENTCTKLVSHCTLRAEGQNVPVKLCMCMFYWAAAGYHHFCYYIIRIVISLFLYKLSLFIITSAFVLFADLAVRSPVSYIWRATYKDRNTWKAIMNFLMKAAMGGECIYIPTGRLEVRMKGSSQCCSAAAVVTCARWKSFDVQLRERCATV